MIKKLEELDRIEGVDVASEVAKTSPDTLLEGFPEGRLRSEDAAALDAYAVSVS